jgi:hypothetical protein
MGLPVANGAGTVWGVIIRRGIQAHGYFGGLLTGIGPMS